jgi:hypothetical protein
VVNRVRFRFLNERLVCEGVAHKICNSEPFHFTESGRIRGHSFMTTLNHGCVGWIFDRGTRILWYLEGVPLQWLGFVRWTVEVGMPLDSFLTLAKLTVMCRPLLHDRCLDSCNISSCLSLVSSDKSSLQLCPWAVVPLFLLLYPAFHDDASCLGSGYWWLLVRFLFAVRVTFITVIWRNLIEIAGGIIFVFLKFTSFFRGGCKILWCIVANSWSETFWS